MKKVFLKRWILAVVGICGMVCSASVRENEITLIMVPRENSAVQLGLDIAARYPTLLVSYRVARGSAVSLHGWTGSQWVMISLDDFESGSFFKSGPASALIVEQSGTSVPMKMIPSAEWCPNVSKITTDQMRPLIHLIGQYYDFSYKNWKWFSKRYALAVDAINPEGLNMAWYHKPMSEHLMKNTSEGLSDLRYWVSVRQAVVAEPIVPVEEEPEVSVVEEPSEEPTPVVEELMENPLTSDVPAAVVMGAGDAPEEASLSPSSSEDVKSVEPVSENSDEL